MEHPEAEGPGVSGTEKEEPSWMDPLGEPGRLLWAPLSPVVCLANHQLSVDSLVYTLSRAFKRKKKRLLRVCAFVFFSVQIFFFLFN